MNIYLVDDDQDDHYFFQEAVSSLGLSTCKVRSFYDGKELLDELGTVDEKPNAVVLDLNMPLVNGFEVLRQLKAHPGFQQVPVFILTTSNKQKDMSKAFDLGCEKFFTKPTQLSSFKSILLEIVSKIDQRTMHC